MKRVPIPELLDTDSGTPAEVAASLSDLYRINRWFGGISTTQSLVENVASKIGNRNLSLLEVASGAGSVPREVQRRLRKRGIELSVTMLDRAATHFGNGSRNGAGAVAGDALVLPFRDDSFDLVCSCIFVHHLGPSEVVKFVREALRVCRRAVLINDLVRSPIHLGLVYAGLPLFRSRLTWHDAPASVRQAYTPAEMRELVRQAGAARVEIERHYLYRMGVAAWKHAV